MVAYKGPDRRKRTRTTDDSIKETFESIVIAFILAFVFRAYVVEAFVIPTGSMAPTLLGEHIRMTCAQCGFFYTADADASLRTFHGVAVSQIVPRGRAPLPDAVCPMCHYPNPLYPGMRVSAGDRILVHKYIYSIAEPRRWDVVVFKNPEKPEINYIKRLVGLPNEELQIIEGNLYVRKLNGSSAGQWHIARKTDTSENPQAFKIQREVFQPVYHSQYVPVDVTSGQPAPGRSRHPWHVPWVPAAGQERDWTLTGYDGYRHASADAGELAFDFELEWDTQVQLYVYNQFKPLEEEPIEDVRLSMVVEPEADGLSISLSTTARLDDPAGRNHRLTATFDPAGPVSLVRTDVQSTRSVGLGQPVNVGPWVAGRSRRIELWYVDQEASVWVDGRPVLVEQFDLDIEPVRHRPEPPMRPDVRVALSGAPAVLHQVELDRDLHYAVTRPGGGIGRGVLVKGVNPSLGEPLTLAADHFFVLGDNSPWSHDSRYWSDIDEWIQYRLFDGKPHYGIVPRKLLMGRAFFVYWPAPWRLNPTQPGFIPNFSEMRFIK